MTLVPLTQNVVTLLSSLTVFGQLIALVFLCSLLRETLTKKPTAIGTLLRRRGVLFLLVVALVATLGSLFFSEIAGWTPCKLCWFQRICMYPQVVLLAIALWRRDRTIAAYVLALCLIGMTFSLVQYAEQVYSLLHPGTEQVCDGSGVSCATTQLLTFGYITIPLMALTAFVMNAVTALHLLRPKTA
ncbi:MAG: disulfide oxidoreductase [Candidatus Peribacteraceae bacterium]|jgi:disulfide bond formation protein DsbB